MSVEVAAQPSAYAQMIASSPSIDARLNLSLDDLIKERKKENKQKKRESVKQETTSPVTKNAQQAEKKKAASKAQSEKRKTKVNKNRGLPLSPQKESTTKAGNKKPKRKDVRQTTTQMKDLKKRPQHHQLSKQTKKTNKVSTQVSKKSKQSTSFLSQKQQRSQQQMKKQKQKQHLQQQPTLFPKKQTRMAMTFTVPTTKPAREVVKTKKGAKLQITLKRSKGDVRRAKKQQQQKILQPKAVKAILPGKSQPKTRKIMAQTLVKKAKVTRSKKQQQSSKNGKFIVRKPVMVRKA